MFNKIRSDVYRSLMLISVIFIIMMMIPSVIIFSSTLYGTYENMAVKKIDRSISSCRNFINSVMTSTDNLASNATILEALTQTDQTYSLTKILDDACNYSIKINAITVYSATGIIYSSSGVAGIPTLEELGQNAGIAEFFADESSTEYISLRTDRIIKIYEKQSYDETQGILSCCKKIYGEQNELIGYIFSDVFSSSLFEYFDYSNDSYYSNSTTVIRYEDGYLSSNANSPYNETLYAANADANAATIANHIIITSARNFYGGTVCVAVSLQPLYGTVGILVGIFLSLGSLFLITIHFISKRNANDITYRLNSLYDKMDTEIKF